MEIFRSFRFEVQDLKFSFSRILKKILRKALFYSFLFTRKIKTVISIQGGYALSWSAKSDKASNTG